MWYIMAINYAEVHKKMVVFYLQAMQSEPWRVTRVYFFIIIV